MMEIKEILRKAKNEGYYLICITVIDLGEYYEVIYHLSKGKEIKDFRFLFRKDEEIPSVKDIFPNAYIYEWEEYEAFGAKFEGARRLFGGEDG